MQEDVGTTAGAIWSTLNSQGELPLTQLKSAVKGKSPIFDWAVGWLAREGKILITREKRTYRIRLKEEHAKAVGAS